MNKGLYICMLAICVSVLSCIAGCGTTDLSKDEGYDIVERSTEISQLTLLHGKIDKQNILMRNHVDIAGAPGRLAIIIDDCGYSAVVLDALARIDAPLTFSIIPYLPDSKIAIYKAFIGNKQIMLHLPMEGLSHANSERSTILTSMSTARIQQITRSAIIATPGLVGINDHQGSKATADFRVMRAVISVIAHHDIYFVDSMTIPTTVGTKGAHEYGVASAENQLFLDNVNEVPYIEGQIRKAVERAHNKSIIVIGHARPKTAQAIANMLEEIRSKGIELVFASQIVE